MAKIFGKNVILKVGEENPVAVGCCLSCSMTVDKELIATNSPSSGEYTEYKEGRKSWMLTASGFVAVGARELELITKGGERVTSFELGGRAYKGKCLVKTCAIDGTLNSMSTYKLTPQGTGKLLLF